jgi:hypothetical protein
MLRISVVLFSLFFIVSSASADVFKYVDDNGVTCYTDAPLGKKNQRIITEKSTLKEPEGKSKLMNIAKTDYSSYVQKSAQKYDIEPELIHAVIRTESNGNQRAISKKGAIGLMQLMPSTASDMNVGNPYNPEENIEGGTRYLKYLLGKFNGNLTLALAAYNSGPKTVERYGSVPPITETRQYVNKVYALYNGKKSYPTSDSASSYKEKPAAIYKVVLEDGTILFTNATLEKKSKIRL